MIIAVLQVQGCGLPMTGQTVAVLVLAGTRDLRAQLTLSALTGQSVSELYNPTELIGAHLERS